jgi:hypothetical protein
MKPYLFLSGLLLGTSISMSSLMADTHVVDASCIDARYGACTSDQTSLTTTNDSTICDFDIDEDVYQGILGFSPAHSRSMLEIVLVVPVHLVVSTVALHVLAFAFPIVAPLALSCALRKIEVMT